MADQWRLMNNKRHTRCTARLNLMFDVFVWAVGFMISQSSVSDSDDAIVLTLFRLLHERPIVTNDNSSQVGAQL